MPFSWTAPTQILERTPSPVFAMALGLSGLGAATRRAAEHFEWPVLAALGAGLLVAAAIVLAGNSALYVMRVLSGRPAMERDLGVATRANLVAPAFMAGMVIGGQLAAHHPGGVWLWFVAVLGHAALLVRFAGRWLTRDYEPGDLNPTWFLPAAGLMTGSMTWPGGVAPEPLAWFAFAAGGAVWMALLPLVFRRVVFEPEFPPALRPSLFIIAAPFGLASNSFMNLAPGAAGPAPVLLGLAGFFFVVVLLSRPRFLLAVRFSLAWWGATFPVATVAAACIGLAEETGRMAYAQAGAVALGLAAVLTTAALLGTAGLAWETCFGTLRGTERDAT